MRLVTREREQERHRVDVDRRETRQPDGARRDERAQPHYGDEHPQPAAEERQDHALRDELAHQTRAAGAERGTERELAASLRAAGEEEVGDVDAGDDEQHEHGREHRQQRGPDFTRDVGLERRDDEPRLKRRPRNARHVGARRPRDGGEIGACRREIDAGANAPDETEVMPPFARVRRERRFVLERPPDARAFRRNVLERRRHDADDDVRIVVERHAAPDDRGIAAESPVPERVAQDDDSRPAVAIVGRREVAAANGSNAERAEVVGADGLSAQPLGFGATLERRRPRLERRERVERMIPQQNLAIRSERDRHRRSVVADVRDHQHAVGVRVGKRLEENRIDRAEDDGRRPDAECQRDRADGGEAGIRAKPPESVTDVDDQRLESALPSGVAHALSRDGRIAELDPRGAMRGAVRHAARDVRVRGAIQIVEDLVVQFGVGGAAIRERAQAAGQLSPERHCQPSALNRRATALARRRQSAVSTSSCFRPARVSA